MTKPELTEFLKSKGYTLSKEITEEYYTDEIWSRLVYNTYKISVIIRNNLSGWINATFFNGDGSERASNYINWLEIIDGELGVFYKIST